MSQEGGRWSRRFLFFFAICLVVLGAVMLAVATFAHHGGQDEAQLNFKEDPPAEVTLLEDEEVQDGMEWTVFAVGILLLTAGLIMLTLCCLCTRQASAPPVKAPPSGVPNNSTPKQVMPPAAAQINGGQIIRGIPLKSSLENLQLTHAKGSCEALDDDIPAHLLHYKPRNFNQHGYGTKMAPMATMDEFDHSLRSSMNSLWSQHLHRQETESLYEESDLDNDALSFHSVVIS